VHQKVGGAPPCSPGRSGVEAPGLGAPAEIVFDNERVVPVMHSRFQDEAVPKVPERCLEVLLALLAPCQVRDLVTSPAEVEAASGPMCVLLRLGSLFPDSLGRLARMLLLEARPSNSRLFHASYAVSVFLENL
jgi:hypothetical protein